MNGRECRVDVPRHRDVVEAPDGDVLRHPEPGLAQGVQRPDGHAVVGGENRSRAVLELEQLPGSGFASRFAEVAGNDQLGWRREARIRKSGAIAAQAFGGVEVPLGAGQDGDSLVSQASEVPDHAEGPIIVLDIQAVVRRFGGRAVQEDNREPRGESSRR